MILPPPKNFFQDSILSADTNSDSDTDSIDTSIDASGILDNPEGRTGAFAEQMQWAAFMGIRRVHSVIR